MASTVSVIIPTYKGSAFIGAALESVYILRTPLPIEIIVVDDYSTDSTADIAEAKGKHSPVPFSTYPFIVE